MAYPDNNEIDYFSEDLSFQEDNADDFTNNKVDYFSETLPLPETDNEGFFVEEPEEVDYFDINYGNDQLQKEKTAIFQSDYDPEGAQILSDRGEVGIADRGVYERSLAEREKKLLEATTSDDPNRPFTPEESEALKQNILNDPKVSLEILGHKPVLMRAQSQQPGIIPDPTVPGDLTKATVERRGVGEQFTELVKSVPGLDTPQELLTQTPVFEADANLLLEQQQQIGDVRSAAQEQFTTQAYNQEIQRVQDEKAAEEERERLDKLNRNYGSSFMAGFTDATQSAIEGLNTVVAVFGAGLNTALGVGEDGFVENFNFLREEGVFKKLNKELGIDYAQAYWDKRSKNTVLGQVTRGLTAGVTDLATLKATSFLKLLNFPVHSAVKRLSKADIKDIGDFGRETLIGGTEGAIMEGALRLGGKLFPKTSVKIAGKEIPLVGYQQVGTGALAVAGAEITNRIFDPEQPLSWKDRMANFATMALMSGKAKGQKHVIMGKKAFQKSRTFKKEMNKLNKLTPDQIAEYENQTDPNVLKKREHIKEFTKDMTRVRDYMENAGRNAVDLVSYMERNPTIKRTAERMISRAHKKANLHITPEKLGESVNNMVTFLEKAPTSANPVIELKELAKKGYITKKQKQILQQKLVGKGKGTRYEGEVPDIVKRARVKAGIEETKVSAERLTLKESMKKQGPAEIESSVSSKRKVLRDLAEAYKVKLKEVSSDKKLTEHREKEFNDKTGINKDNIEHVLKLTEIPFSEMTQKQRSEILERVNSVAKGTFKMSDTGAIINLDPKTARSQTFNHEWAHGVENKIATSDPKLHAELKNAFREGFKKSNLGKIRDGNLTRAQSEAFAQKAEKFSTGEYLPPKEKAFFEKMFKKSDITESILATPHEGKTTEHKFDKKLKDIRKSEVKEIKKIKTEKVKKEAKIKLEKEKLETVEKESVKKSAPKKGVTEQKSTPKDKKIEIDKAIVNRKLGEGPLDILTDIETPKTITKIRKGSKSWEERRGDGLPTETYSTFPEGEYTPELIRQAKKTISAHGEEAIVDHLNKIDFYGPTDMKMMEILSEKRLDRLNPGDFEAASKITSEGFKKGTLAGRTVQAMDFAIKDRFTPEQMLHTMTYLENLELKQWKNPEKFKKALKKKAGKDTIVTEKNYTKWRKEAELLDNMPTDATYQQRARDRAEMKLLRNITSSFPKQIGKKASSFQVLAQLFNIKTISRNIFSNKAFYQMEAATQATLGAWIDRGVRKFTNIRSLKGTKRGTGKELFSGAEEAKWKSTQKGNRIRGMGEHLNELVNHQVDLLEPYIDNWIKESGRETLKEEGIDIKSQTGKFDITTDVMFEKGVLNNVEKQLKRFLIGPDRVSFVKRFEQSMKQQIEAYNLNLAPGVEKLKVPTQEMAVAAYRDGLHSTFQDLNVVSRLSTEGKRWLNKNLNAYGYGFGELLLKYPKTPANLIHRAYEYSPFGAVDGLFKIRKAVNEIKSMQARGELILDKAKKGDSQESLIKAMNLQRTAVMKLTRGISGTALTGIGYALANTGIITPGQSDDKKKNAVRQALGIRNYSLFGKISLDWIQPIMDSVLIGADINQMVQEKSQDSLSWGAVGTGLLNYIDLMSETIEGQGVLKGVKTMFSQGNIKDGFLQVASQAPASFFPTLFSQARYATDPKLREVYKKGETGITKFFGNMMRSVANKTPGLSHLLDPRKTVIGKDMSTLQMGEDNVFKNPLGYVLHGIAAFGSPAIIQATRDDKNLQWIMKMYKELDTTKVIPTDRRFTNKFKVDGVTYSLNTEERGEFLDTFWSDVEKKLENLRTSSTFEKSTHETKIRLISKIYRDAAKIVRKDIAKNRVK